MRAGATHQRARTPVQRVGRRGEPMAPPTRELREALRGIFRHFPVTSRLDDERVTRTLQLLFAHPRRALSPLLSFLPSSHLHERWNAVMLMGRLVARHANDDMEWARITIRKLMWYLNDESGGIGWGVPEAFGEILRHHRGLAEEYHPILFSYVDPRGNLLDQENLIEGVLWGVLRVASRHPTLYASQRDTLMPFLSHARAPLRAYAALTIAFLDAYLGIRDSILGRLSHDDAMLTFCWDTFLGERTVGEILQSFAPWHTPPPQTNGS